MAEEALRLQVYLARCGLGSRRKCEDYIQQGRIQVNGKPLLTLGTKVKVEDQIRFDGRLVYPEKEKVYIALHKPPGFICSNQDRTGRPLAVDLLKGVRRHRLFNVGRLDYMTSGLIFFTNDGEFSRAMTHPSGQVEKEYIVTAKKEIPEELLEAFQKGIRVQGELFRLKSYRRRGPHSVSIVLEEGKNRELRKVFLSRRITIKSIHRVRIGGIRIAGIKAGHFRYLRPREVQGLLKGTDK